jgi:hypothetical protein
MKSLLRATFGLAAMLAGRTNPHLLVRYQLLYQQTEFYLAISFYLHLL